MSAAPRGPRSPAASAREPTARQTLGEAGEALAAQHLEQLGFSIVARNHRTRRGEVDLIAEQGELLVFVEVRTRASDKFGSPEETVDARKQERVVLAARDFLARFQGGERAIRFDVIAVVDEHGAPRVRHIPDAFDAGGF